MHPTPSTKIPFRDIKDHADLMNAFEQLNRAVAQEVVFDWDNSEQIQNLKSEIAHFLRIQSTQPGVAFDDENNDPMRHSGGETKDVRKNSNNP
jgi:hypothetical protein